MSRLNTTATARRILSVGPLVCVAILSQTARADVTVEACSDAYTKGQEERLAGRAFNARTQFSICSDLSCPAIVIRDCRQWQTEIEAELPTIVVKASDSTGNPIDQLSVFIDGSSTPTPHTEQPIVMDAGPHRIRFDAPGYEPLQVEASLRPEDKNVPVSAVLHRLPPPPPAVSEAVLRQPVPHPERHATPVAAAVLAGVGVVALGGSLYFGLRAKSQYDDYKAACAPVCTESQTHSVTTKAVISDIALGTSVVAFGAAAWLYLSAESNRKPSAASAALGIEPSPGGARARLRVTF